MEFKLDSTITAHLQSIDSRITYVNKYDNGMYIVGVERGHYIFPHIGMLSIEELRQLYRDLSSGKTVVRECSPLRTIPGRNGPIGAPSFLKGTW